MNTAVFHRKGNKKSAELALPCDDNEYELAFNDCNDECVFACVYVSVCVWQILMEIKTGCINL